MVNMSLRLTASAQRQRELVTALHGLLGPTRVAAGCLGCDLYQDVENPNVLLYTESWRAQEDLDRRIRSASFKTVIGIMEAAAGPPEIQLNWVSQVKGMEYLAKVRLGQV
jgi:quinol monooxygenase YgiN